MESFFEIFKAAFVLFGVSFSWACSSQFAKSTLNFNIQHFYAPYSLVWFNTCFMIVCYPVFLVYNRLWNGISLTDSNKEAVLIFSSKNFTLSALFFRVMPFLFLWIAANYSYSVSLTHVSASAALSLLSSNTCIVWLMGWFLFKETFSPIKLIAVIMTVVGVVIISMDKKFAGNFFGVFLVLLCAFFSASYKVLFKLINKKANLGQVSIFMSSLGLLNMTLNWIPMIILHYLKVDYIEWSYVPWTPLIITAILALTFNFFVNFGIALLNPLVISIGMLVGLPLSATIDIVFRGIPLTAMFSIGTVLIIVSFIFIAFPIENWLCQQRQRSSLQQ